MAVDTLVAILKDEIAAEPYMVAPAAALDAMRQLPAKIEPYIQATDWEKVTDIVVDAYSTIDKLLPDIFDPADAVKLTENLFQPRALRIRGEAMMWGKVWGAKGSNEEDIINHIGAYLREHPEIVKTFGHPRYEETDERYWRWWEFALFDGSRWHSFHLNTAFEVSLEVGSRSVKLLEQILDEFRRIVVSTR
jgi:hypothetical protein